MRLADRPGEVCLGRRLARGSAGVGLRYPGWAVPSGGARGLQPVLTAQRTCLPGGGLTAALCPPCVRLSPPLQDPSRTPRHLCPGLQSRALKVPQAASSLTFTKFPWEQPGRCRLGLAFPFRAALGGIRKSSWPGEGQTG